MYSPGIRYSFKPLCLRICASRKESRDTEMSVFGGDCWAREAEYRKRRVDDLVTESLDRSSFKKLSNGKYACLVCPHNPILDSPLMLSMHSKGSWHRAAESRLKKRELMKQGEINKRLALSDSAVASANSGAKKVRLGSSNKPLVEQTRKVASEILCQGTSQMDSRKRNFGVKLSNRHGTNVTTSFCENSSCFATKASDRLLGQGQLDFCQRREKELKFIEAGWKRDCHGRWYKDENVEFDSDEEDPNFCLG